MNQLTILTIFNFIVLASAVQCDEIYQWKDANGIVHFSNEAPLEEHSQFNKPPIQQITMIKTTAISNTSKSRRHPQKRDNSPSKCNIIIQKITKLENELTTRLKASSFDLKNEKLNKLRWQKIKLC